MNIGCCIIGIYYIILVIVRLFRPFFGYTKGIIAVLNIRNTTKGYLIASQITSLLIGLIFIAAGILPDQYLLTLCVPLFAILIIGIIVCNKIFLGTIAPLFIHV